MKTIADQIGLISIAVSIVLSTWIYVHGTRIQAVVEPASSRTSWAQTKLFDRSTGAWKGVL